MVPDILCRTYAAVSQVTTLQKSACGAVNSTVKSMLLTKSCGCDKTPFHKVWEWGLAVERMPTGQPDKSRVARHPFVWRGCVPAINFCHCFMQTPGWIFGRHVFDVVKLVWLVALDVLRMQNIDASLGAEGDPTG